MIGLARACSLADDRDEIVGGGDRLAVESSLDRVDIGLQPCLPLPWRTGHDRATTLAGPAGSGRDLRARRWCRRAQTPTIRACSAFLPEMIVVGNLARRRCPGVAKPTPELEPSPVAELLLSVSNLVVETEDLTGSVRAADRQSYPGLIAASV